MKRFISIISIVLLLFAFTGTAKAWVDLPPLVAEKATNANEIYEHNCDIELVNNTDNYYVFWLAWIDHPFLHQTKGKPWNKTGGGLAPKESFAPESKYAPGLYTITYWDQWANGGIKMIRNFTILPETRKIIISVVMVLPMEIPIITLSFTPMRHIRMR